jgi:predicted secreted protein
VTRLVFCVAALLPVLVNGCGGEEGPREGGAGETSTTASAPQVITEADSGGSFTLPRGSKTSLRLSGEYGWTEPTVEGAAVQLARVDYFQDPGFSEWAVVAVQPGKATIATRGTPACAAQGCPDAPLRFRVELTVAP